MSYSIRCYVAKNSKFIYIRYLKTKFHNSEIYNLQVQVKYSLRLSTVCIYKKKKKQQDFYLASFSNEKTMIHMGNTSIG